MRFRGSGSAAGVAALVVGTALAWLSACAAPGSDLALAPLYTRHGTADGRVEVEAAGGLWRQRWNAATGAFENLTVGPLYSLDRVSPERRRSSGPDALPAELTGGGSEGRPVDDGDWLSRFLVPLGFTSHRGGETTSVLIPFYLWTNTERADGRRAKRLYTILGFISRKNEGERAEISWFPFAGKLDDFLTYDRIVFFLWPFLVYAERDGKISWHVPWPLIGWTRGGGETSDHVLPLYSRAAIAGRYSRWAFLWPFLHWQSNHLGGGGEEPESVWWLFPLLGQTRRGTYQSTSLLWPLFGWASDSRSGFWAWDGPFFFVRFQRGPDGVRRDRVWPFYGYLETEGLRARSFLWPIVQLRHEEDADSRRDSTWVVPVWQRWDRVALEDGQAVGEPAAWRKLFPLFQWEREAGWTRGSFPTLDPLWRNELVDRHFAWTWKLFEWETDAERGIRRERAWAGLWKRERDPLEDRAHLSFLWSRRRYRDDERRVTEQSLLFGLLRWRVTAGEGFDILRPAFPGPGWPARAQVPAAPLPEGTDGP